MKVTIEDDYGTVAVLDNPNIEFELETPVYGLDLRPFLFDGRHDQRYGPGPRNENGVKIAIHGQISPPIPPLKFEAASSLQILKR